MIRVRKDGKHKQLEVRGQDDHGSGQFGASRVRMVEGGTRRYKHHGVDYVCKPADELLAPVSGTVSKLGFPYANDLAFRYVEITVPGGDCHRVFYCKPAVEVGDQVIANVTPIGKAQKLGDRYKGITEHVHYEIKRGGTYVDPTIAPTPERG